MSPAYADNTSCTSFYNGPQITQITLVELSKISVISAISAISGPFFPYLKSRAYPPQTRAAHSKKISVISRHSAQSADLPNPVPDQTRNPAPDQARNPVPDQTCNPVPDQTCNPVPDQICNPVQIRHAIRSRSDMQSGPDQICNPARSARW
jgi:hypothetical protein